MNSERWSRTIAHADMDAFYASVEQLDDPALRGRPVLVGPNSDRGVVLTASYEARPARVGSAMPMAVARRRCPDAVIVPPRFERYREVSRQVMEVFGDFSPSVEALSLDEAFLDMTGSDHVFGPPEAFARRLKGAVADATGGLTVSVGVSGTKYVAKVASGFRKPDGLTVVTPEHARAWLEPQSVAVLWGAGPKMQARLAQLGLVTVGQVASANAETLTRTLGHAALHFQALARGEDARAVEARREPKSISSEQTLEADIHAPVHVRRELQRAAAAVARRLRKQGYCARGVRIKLKRSDFRLLSRQATLSEATQSAERLSRAALGLFDTVQDRGPYRLIGLAAFDLVTETESAQLDLLADDSQRSARLETTLDAIADRFGAGTVRRAGTSLGLEAAQGDMSLDFLRRTRPDVPKPS